MKLEMIMLEDMICSEYEGYSDMKTKLEEEEYNENSTFLRNEVESGEHDIVEDYKQAEEFRITLRNQVEVRTQILEDNLAQTGDDLEDYNVLYTDVKLSAIAEALTDVTVDDLQRNLSVYGTWEIITHDGLYTLIDFA